MFKLILFLISAMFLSGNCDHHHDSNDHHPGKSGNVELNQGKRWQADDPTKAGFAKLKTDLYEFEKGKNGKFTNKDYNELAKIATGSIDSIFSSCKMTGKSHDELHKYIATLLEDIKPLKGNDLKESQASFTKLKSDLQKFSDYFE